MRQRRDRRIKIIPLLLIMATSDLPLAIVTCRSELRPICKQLIDSYRNKLTILLMKDLTEDQYSKVEGALTIGKGCSLGTSLMDSFPSLHVISTPSAGVDHIDVTEASKKGIKIGFCPDEAGESTADLAFALLLASARNIVQGYAMCKHPNTSEFDNFRFGLDVNGSTIGIVGLGNIGSAVAQRAKGFNMKILYHTRTRRDTSEKEIGAEYCHQLTDLLKQADFVVLCIPLTPETKYFISAKELSIMKPSATLINVARGDVVNQDDLVKALQSGQIRGAALDVTSPEPLPKDHPLLTLPNVLITPHIGSFTEATRLKMLKVAMENLVAGLYGEPLLFQKH